jgi:hypothetical protein
MAKKFIRLSKKPGGIFWNPGEHHDLGMILYMIISQ